MVSQKKTEDAALASFINNNVDVKARYGSLMADIDELYKLINGDAKRDLWLSQIYNSTSLMGVSKNINVFKTAMEAQPENMRAAFFTQNKARLKQFLAPIYESYDLDADTKIFKKMLTDAAGFTTDQPVNAVDQITGKSATNQQAIDKYISKVFANTKLKDTNYVYNTLMASPEALSAYNDELLSFEKGISAQIAQLKPEKDRREGMLNKLMGDYVNVKEKFLKKDFIPDANSTLRLTYGHVRGYWAADASYMHPYTTIKGILEKGTTGNPEFDYPAQIKQLWEAKDFGPFAKKDLNDVPVGLLYNMDTTGGNSGSPIMNAYGELIGVNFDRAYGATINDYAWNESYSRSIGVDIRYVLWVAAKIDKANFLLKEIGVKI